MPLDGERKKEYQREYFQRPEIRAKAYARGSKLYYDRKEWVISLQTPCVVCGEDEPCVIEWHHVNPEEKEYNVTRMFKMNKKKVLAEIDKCVCLCRNCHARVHAGVITL
tara:strand:+ start:377 stop:703 length:327 start_codon:yes stop_codon:yes gene_type:complete